MSHGPQPKPPPSAQGWQRIVEGAPEPGALPFLGFFVEMAEHLIEEAGRAPKPFWPRGRPGE